jgi:hypothetical protein
MAPSVDHVINCQRRKPFWPLRHDDASAALIKFMVKPIAVESLVSQQVLEINAINERRHANGVMAIARQENEADKIAQCVCQCEDFGRPAPFRLADGLTLSPPFAPCP